MSPIAKRLRSKRTVIAVLIVVFVGVAAFWGFRASHATPAIPTVVVRRGEFVDWVELHGQIKALESVLVSAGPSVGDFRILSLVPNGTHVKKGQVIARFDATQLEQTLAKDRVALKSAQAQVDQERAKARTKENQDLTTLMTDQYNVQNAKLEASKAEIVSQIQGEENELKLADARAQLSAAEATLKQDRISDAANVGGKQEVSDQAAYQVRTDLSNLSQLTIRAPSDGVVSLLRYIYDRQTQQERALRPGDNVWPGAPIAQIPNLSSLEVVARVDEIERGRLAVGQRAEIRFSAVPGRSFPGHVKTISTIATIDYSAGWPFPRNFTVDIALDQTDPLLLPDESGTVRVAVDRVPNGLVIPTQAVFDKNGERTAYVLANSRFEPRTIVVTAESDSQALVAKGLTPGERVALQNPFPGR